MNQKAFDDGTLVRGYPQSVVLVKSAKVETLHFWKNRKNSHRH